MLLLLIIYRMPGALEALLQHPIVAKIACMGCIAGRDGRTALHHAAFRGRHDIAQLLLQKLPSSEITRVNSAGKAASHLARESGHPELAEFLASVAKVGRATGMQ